MRELQSFDAFYARTVQSVTSKMHELAGGDPQADHAVREAYARAYQQWFEVSGYRDAEGWVLDVAKEAYERRRGQAGPVAAPPGQLPATGTWPGMYREPSPPRQPTADRGATVTGPIGGGAFGAGAGEPNAGPDGGPGTAPPASPYQPNAAGADWFQSGAAPADPHQPAAAQGGQVPPAAGQAPPYAAGAAWGGSFAAAAGAAAPSPTGAGFPSAAAQQDPLLAGATGPLDGFQSGPDSLPAPGQPASGGSLTRLLDRPGASKVLIAALAVIMIVAIGTSAYLALGHKSAAAGNGTHAHVQSKPQPQMLAAGHVGSRSAVPWTLVGAGWVLAEVATAAPDAQGTPSGSGSIVTYLVDPKGGRYLMQQSSATTSAPTLVAWSGNADTALFGSTGGYSLLNLRTGQVANLTLPQGVAVAGFTRPDGLNLVAVQQGPQRYKLQRYSLTGALSGQLSFLPVRTQQLSWIDGCGSSCGALSSPDGITAVWGTSGDEMQLVSNRGGIIRRLHVPGSGSPPSCIPMRWWSPGMVLASCAAPATAGTARRLWLVPADGAAPTALTLASGSPSGAGFYTGAWRAGASIYVTATSATQCPQDTTGSAGIDILRMGRGGSDSPISVPGSTGYHNAIAGSVDGRLIVLAQTSCPGTSSLVSFNPATGAIQTLLPGASGQSGVVAALMYGTQ